MDTPTIIYLSGCGFVIFCYLLLNLYRIEGAILDEIDNGKKAD